MRRQRPYVRSSKRGSTLVEFAFIAFTLFLVTFAGIELDRMVFVYTNISDAAKAGVRYAITHGDNKTVGASGPTDTPSGAAVVDLVKFYLTGIDKSKAASEFAVEVTYPNGTNASGDPVKVVVRYKYDPFVLISGFNVWLSATARGIITY